MPPEAYKILGAYRILTPGKTAKKETFNLYLHEWVLDIGIYSDSESEVIFEKETIRKELKNNPEPENKTILQSILKDMKDNSYVEYSLH